MIFTKAITKCLCLLLFTASAFANGVTPEQFTQWWNQFEETNPVPSELKTMEDYFVSSSLIDRCSKYWLFLNKKNIEQISQHGYANFKQTVARNYFTWVVNNLHGYAKNLYNDHPLSLAISPSELLKKHAYFTEAQSIHYNLTTALFYEYLVKNGAGPYLKLLEEPFYGNPLSITIDGQSISQDVLNSLLEYLSLTTHCDLSPTSTILELGAGSGRTAYCFLKLMPDIKYIIVDIPPALFLSQTYLSSVFPNKKIFRFRPFTHFEEVQAEFIVSDILFLTPDQMLQLPNQSVDLFMAIDCLHEMKVDEVQSYFDEADRLSSLFYFKCWNNTVVPFDEIPYTARSYPVPAAWHKIFESGCFVPSDFFHAFYRVRNLSH